MEYRYLGNSGLQVSVVGLGTNNFGGRMDFEAAQPVIHKCLDMGITFFDTADVYGGRGKSEEILAPALKDVRHDVVIATKSYSPMGEGPYWSGASRKYLSDALDACLRRLDTDYIDFYQMHRWDSHTPIDETLRFLDDAVSSGKVRYIGNSNYTGWQVVESAWAAKTQRLTPFIGAQNAYSLLDRDVEKELVPACLKYGLGLIPYSPLAGGFLTGKYRPDQAPPEGARLSSQQGGRILNEGNFNSLIKLEKFAGDHGHSMVDLAVGWLASQPVVSSVIAGASTPEQVEQNCKAGEWRLTAAELTEIDEIMGVNQPSRRG
ncbi:MAG: aldo/keto reductase [Dehalococcoidia bacterium]|nr:aldo/keto reductase [Dehalococcoidia bacterium]